MCIYVKLQNIYSSSSISALIFSVLLYIDVDFYFRIDISTVSPNVFFFIYSDGYYLCQTLQHVYATSAKFKIQWLSERPQQADTYKLDYIDHSQPECIITHVKLKKLVKDVYRLPEYQKAKIKKHLNEALRPEEDIEENENEEPEVESEEGEQEEESSPGEDEESADSDDGECVFR